MTGFRDMFGMNNGHSAPSPTERWDEPKDAPTFADLVDLYRYGVDDELISEGERLAVRRYIRWLLRLPDNPVKPGGDK